MMRGLQHLARRLRRDERGVTIIEFALLAPVMIGVVMGFGDLAYQAYAQAQLDGTLQKAGRDSTIQGAAQNTAAIDEIVKKQVRMIANGATFTSTRKSYSAFSKVAPEKFTDDNNNKVRDPGECFEDINGNKAWDADPGTSGQGGANDVTLYTMTVDYPRLFPVAGLFGFSNTQRISARTLLKNQPYASQAVKAVTTICT